MDWQTLLISAVMTQVLSFCIKKSGWQPFVQKWGIYYFIIPAAFFSAVVIYQAILIFNPWGSVQAGLKHY